MRSTAATVQFMTELSSFIQSYRLSWKALTAAQQEGQSELSRALVPELR